MRLAPLLLLALLAPTAAAQLPLVTPTPFGVFAEDPGRAFVPGSVEDVTIVVNYGPGQGGRPMPAPTLERPENTTPTRITLAVKTLPSWITGVTFEPEVILVVMGIENVNRSSFTYRSIAHLNVSPDAPALERESFVVTATAEPNGNIQGASSESPELKLRATTVGIVNVTAEPVLVTPGGRWIDVPFTVRNDGNSPIVAKLNVTVRPENSQVRFPETLELARGEERVVIVEMRTPWTNAEFGTLELEAVPIVDGEEGNAARAEIAVTGESAVPLGPAIAAALAVAALRRRK